MPEKLRRLLLTVFVAMILNMSTFSTSRIQYTTLSCSDVHVHADHRRALVEAGATIEISAGISA